MNNFVVYTVLTGTESRLNNPFPDSCGNFEKICFTDNTSINPNGWNLEKIESHFLDPTREARRIKLLPHLFLAEFEWSLYIDNTVKFKVDPLDIYKIYHQKQKNFWSYRHPDRNCIYQEAKQVIKLHYDDEHRVMDQMNQYTRLGYPKNIGLIASTVLLRRHNHSAVSQLGEIWYEHVLRFSRRDQLSFNFVAWKLNFDYGHFDGDIKHSPYVLYPGYQSQPRIPKDFDSVTYVNLYPEIKSSGMEPREHYLEIGSQMGFLYNESDALRYMKESSTWRLAKKLQNIRYRIVPHNSTRMKILKFLISIMKPKTQD